MKQSNKWGTKGGQQITTKEKDRDSHGQSTFHTKVKNYLNLESAKQSVMNKYDLANLKCMVGANQIISNVDDAWMTTLSTFELTWRSIYIQVKDCYLANYLSAVHHILELTSSEILKPTRANFHS